MAPYSQVYPLSVMFCAQLWRDVLLSVIPCSQICFTLSYVLFSVMYLLYNCVSCRFATDHTLRLICHSLPSFTLSLACKFTRVSHVCILIYTHTQLCMDVFVCTRMNVRVCVCVCSYRKREREREKENKRQRESERELLIETAHTHAHTRIRTHTHSHSHTRIHTHTRTLTHTHAHTHTTTHSFTHTHTHAHAHAQTLMCFSEATGGESV